MPAPPGHHAAPACGSHDFRRLLAEGGVPTWQAVLARIGVAIAAVVLPRVLATVERMAIAGSPALLARLEAAGLPASSTDTALAIVRGIERDTGEHAVDPARRMTGPGRAAYARDAIRRWMLAQGGAPDEALVNQVLEEAVGRLRVEQQRITERLRHAPA